MSRKLASVTLHRILWQAQINPFFYTKTQSIMENKSYKLSLKNKSEYDE